MNRIFCLLIVILCSQLVSAQQNEIKFHSFEANYFTGTIMEHNPDISHLITGHPTGLILSYNRKTYGFEEVEARYNYPDWGVTFIYQDLKNPFLGENYSLYGHFNFYFLNRNLTVGIGQGVAYANNPYDPETNFQNNAYGSRFLSSTILRANFIKENLFEGLGFQAGFGVIHYSNANFKAPNNSTNTLYFNAGLSYQLDPLSFPTYIPETSWRSSNYAERIKYNFAFRTGINEADVNGLGQFPFYTFSVFADKRLNYKSTLQAGVDVYFSDFLIELIRYRSIAFPEDGLTGDEDYRRIGIFVGHELRFHKVAFVSQLGYYVYWPYEFENRVYNRLGIKRYFYRDKLFGSVTVKAHYAKAEAVEFSIGVRL
ncbi:lipid A 3-O-deacylase PagL [Ulvibacter sp. MAR_2010_11]|uniref:acyloxyacyl hydrolase n=1 Tax=Ulvibacter sp. MAR_2010_11 TaxID=1250229 RepID=UPI000C2C03CC|nr:acyloxyacyl hydrolase [Ulvibacter sp. MAR_2010_11]PKA82397.1 lipid A 3-O-deacylase PagL [Ulvibacter sp. MAR_2010_11]